MRILALEPYHGGSHAAFLAGWSSRSRHEWTVMPLPPFKWKWRMRHGAITLAEAVTRASKTGQYWDVLLCSDMLNLAEFRGLAPETVRRLPTVAYFHENQLTYPVRHESERDYHFVLTNLTTALAAEAVWFNSAFHRDSFLDALPVFLKRMPDHQPYETVEDIRAKAAIRPPGIDPLPPRSSRAAGPMRLLWAARWEHDKNPETFLAALDLLDRAAVPFRLSILGEQFREYPVVFDEIRVRWEDRIDHWGYQPDRQAYEQVLCTADVIVSSALHEFFGLSVVEAVAAGGYPLLPRRLAYPELFASAGIEDAAPFLYDGSAEDLAGCLRRLAGKLQKEGHVCPSAELAESFAQRYGWDALATAYDEAIEALVKRAS